MGSLRAKHIPCGPSGKMRDWNFLFLAAMASENSNAFWMGTAGSLDVWNRKIGGVDSVTRVSADASS